MPSKTETTVYQSENGQYKITIPKAIADALNLNGKKADWEIVSKNEIKINVSD